MAGEKAREIKSRIRSIRSTEKITKAMGLVASSRLGRAKNRMERSRPYFQILYDTLLDIAGSSQTFSSPYLHNRDIKASGYVLIGGDKGFAGGYNNNVFKKMEEHGQGQAVHVLPIGKKCLEYCERKNLPVISSQYSNAADCNVGSCFEISKLLCEAFLSGELDEVVLVYTNFVSMLAQTPLTLRLLPLLDNGYNERAKSEPRKSLLYEPGSEEVYNAIVPEYVAGLIYGGWCEAQTSELGARHTAMDAASRNAEEILDLLDVRYNSVRQADITQQLTEIISGVGEYR